MAQTKLVVTQTIGCTPDDRTLISVVNATPTTSYSADYGIASGTISYRASGGFLKNPDLAISTTADGRLSAINASASGQGGTVLKDVAAIGIGFATAGAGGAAIAGAAAATESGGAAATGARTRTRTSPVQEDCKRLEKLAASASKAAGANPGAGHAAVGAGAAAKAPKTLTLTYSITLIYATDGVQFEPGSGYSGGALQVDPENNPQGYPTTPTTTLTLLPDPDSLAAYEGVKLIQNTIQVTSSVPWQAVDDYSGWVGKPTWDPAHSVPPMGFQAIELNRVADVHVEVVGPGSLTDAQGAPAPRPVKAWSGIVEVPLHAHYPLLIPKGMPFGQQTFALALSDAGTITKLEYGGHSGAVEAFGAATSVAKGLPTDETRATELQYQSDLIYQQQRLVACQANHATCAGK